MNHSIIYPAVNSNPALYVQLLLDTYQLINIELVMLYLQALGVKMKMPILEQYLK